MDSLRRRQGSFRSQRGSKIVISPVVPLVLVAVGVQV